ncbi:hypothetical protein O1611_g10242 [Lasiodiplodia mahajangana]|uniref:Uncharacterized protein n=1 Tax=Lasiodiplodia mahajangana TaxID=1108764 RepID=A0ACC2J0E0_9PEZI|nr:hypothetical protein O1611_g10242 [Lasiodiplodia mahajangana]
MSYGFVFISFAVQQTDELRAGAAPIIRQYLTEPRLSSDEKAKSWTKAKHEQITSPRRRFGRRGVKSVVKKTTEMMASTGAE